jgi:hypothetical protein
MVKIDVVVLEIQPSAQSGETIYRAFTPGHVHRPSDLVAVGTTLLIVGVITRLPRRTALYPCCAPCSGSVLVPITLPRRGLLPHRFAYPPRHQRCAGRDREPMRGDTARMLPGVHSARIDLGTRDLLLEEARGLNCAW